MVDYEGKPKHQLQFLDGQRMRLDAKKQHVVDVNKKWPATNYKTDYSDPQATGDVEFFKHYKHKARTMKFDRNITSHYDEMNNKMLAAKQRGRRNNDLY